ncbi:copper amine oxidase N-terminal domain-containing protein [Aceticella autotrophica]|uniref:Copper amine oxidase N-terminal domain-containing protein n=1 Tax=Aceticella autotrophica TaxID=2755338 RepID=A0A975AV76_9THEO|nr:copper amine oxidase N-terminal domain-containing protein [Aceticella autotrophica]QSZ27051.1 copper amine oxidase N-terminal domain-containing protein [Aceticella autotrophica]
MKSSKKWLSMLMVLAMMLGMIGAMPSVAMAGTTYSAITAIPTFNANSSAAQNQNLATINADIKPVLTNQQSSALVQVVDSEGSLLDINSLSVSGDVYSQQVTQVASNVYKVTLTLNAGTEANVQFSVNVNAQNCAAGNIKVQFSKAFGQLMNGDVVAGVATTPQVNLTAVDTPAFGDSGTRAHIRINESLAGSLKKADDSVKLTLPLGFTWDVTNANIDILTGNADLTVNPITLDSGRTLQIKCAQASSISTLADLYAPIKVDISMAKKGDVVATVGGKSTVSPSTLKDGLKVGTYGDYTVTVNSVETKTIDAGKVDQEIGKFAIDEALPGTLVEGRTIVLTLPDNARWIAGNYPQFDTNLSTDCGFQISSFTPVESDVYGIKTLMAKVTTSSSGNNAPHLVFSGGKITVKAGYTGDIALTVSGSAGANGTATVATVKSVTATASSKPAVIIGLKSQPAGDVTLTETMAGQIKSTDNNNQTGYIKLKLPQGVSFADTPKFEVTDGDLVLDSIVTYDSGYPQIKVKGSSTKASTIKISNIKLTVDRTVPEGNVSVGITGNALVENGGTGKYFPNDTIAARATIATVVTPAPSEEKTNVVFTIGSTTYTLNGTTQTMDVAPYVENDRTYLPVRYVAKALGVSDDNILYDDATGTVTLIKGDKIVKMTIGSNVMTINGTTITMDVPATLKNDRTMLPFRWIAQVAFGAKVNYDPNANTVTMDLYQPVIQTQ